MESSRKSRRTEAPADLVAALAACLERHVLPGHRLVVGLSGGLDSVSLLHALTRTRLVELQRCELAALHVNHGLSPQADHWETRCRDYCAGLGVPFAAVRVNVAHGTPDGLEAEARRARHEVFAKATADWVVLAHHRDDQAETLLFNLLRGAGVAGAAGMHERRGPLLRPLLAVARAEIERYARTHHLAWVEDESNADVSHSRNFLRHRILSELSRRFPAAKKNLAAAAARFAEAQALLDDLARQDLGSDGADFPLSVERLRSLDAAHARNVLRYLLARRQVMISSEVRLDEAIRQMCTAALDRHPALLFGKHRLLRRQGWIYLEPADDCGDSR